MDLSVIIVSWNVRALLEKCLFSVFNPPVGGQDFEIFVVDNNSTDGSAEMVREKFPQVKLISNKENRGFAVANNQAIKKAKGDFVLLLNPDTEILDNALEKMVDFMKNHLDCGIAGCQILNPDKTVQPSVRMFPDLFTCSLMVLKLHHFKPIFSLLGRYFAKDFDYSKTQPVEQVMGAFFMIRKEVIEKIGLLDEGYYLWFEEVDYCRRLLKKTDYKIYYTPVAQVIHYGGQSFKQVMTLKKQWLFYKSMMRYFRKKI